MADDDVRLLSGFYFFISAFLLFQPLVIFPVIRGNKYPIFKIFVSAFSAFGESCVDL